MLCPTEWPANNPIPNLFAGSSVHAGAPQSGPVTDLDIEITLPESASAPLKAISSATSY